jgi:outer membrane protein
MKARALLIGCVALLAGATQVQAEESVPRHWIARIGIHPVDPKPDNHPEYQIDNAAGVSLGATYLFSKHWGLELFGAFPPAHELRTAGGDRAGRFDMRPASATIQYHITDASGVFRAYAGAGIAYANIGGERTKGALAGSTLEIDDASGVALTLGLDMDLGSKWFVNIDARWLDIDSDLRIDGVDRGQLAIDPVLFGLSIGRQFK